MKTPRFLTGAIIALLAVSGGAVAMSAAQADPNVETVLPADGVTSIERVGDVWTVTMEAAPSEVKVMTPDLGPQCGTNYVDRLGLCQSTRTFTASGPCVYIQVDGIPGHVSSDPFVCRTTPTATTPGETTWPTTPTESSPASTSPATTPPASSTSAPSIPSDTAPPVVTPTSSASSTIGATSENVPTNAPRVGSPAPLTLAATGYNLWHLAPLVALLLLVGVAAVVNARLS